MQLLGVIGGPEIIVILLIVLVLFGGKKIPELMKGLGKGVKEYKKAMNGVEDELNGVVQTGEPSAKQETNPESPTQQANG